MVGRLWSTQEALVPPADGSSARRRRMTSDVASRMADLGLDSNGDSNRGVPSRSASIGFVRTRSANIGHAPVRLTLLIRGFGVLAPGGGPNLQVGAALIARPKTAEATVHGTATR